MDNYDIFCMSSGIHLPRINPNIYFYEPFNNLENSLVKPVEVLWRCIDALNVSEANKILNKNKTGCIISPQPFQKYSILPVSTITRDSDWFYVNESSLTTGIRGFRKYLKEIKSSNFLLLNYRCTLFRAISVAIVMDYETISIIGLDPSTPDYWFMNQSLFEDFLTSDSHSSLPILHKFGRDLKVIAKNMNIKSHQDYARQDDGGVKDYNSKSIPSLLFLLLSELALTRGSKSKYLNNALAKTYIYSEDPLISKLAAIYGMKDLIYPLDSFR